MATYSLQWKPSSLRELKKLDRKAVPRILKSVESLPVKPYPPGVRKIQGSVRCYRIRVGDYRVIYSVYESRLVIEIIRVRHRKDAYAR